MNFLLLLYLYFNFLLNFFLWNNFFQKIDLQASISIVQQSICSIYKHTEVTKYNSHSYTGIRAKVKTFQVGTQKIPAQTLQYWGGTLAPGFFSFFRVFLHISASLVKRVIFQLEKLKTMHASSLIWFIQIGIYRRHLSFHFLSNIVRRKWKVVGQL